MCHLPFAICHFFTLSSFLYFSGTTTAVVKVGYTYDDCSDTIWDVQTTKIAGQDLRVSDVGGWDFDIHHRYNPQEGVLYKGDGSNVFLRERPR